MSSQNNNKTATHKNRRNRLRNLWQSSKGNTSTSTEDKGKADSVTQSTTSSTGSKGSKKRDSAPAAHAAAQRDALGDAQPKQPLQQDSEGELQVLLLLKKIFLIPNFRHVWCIENPQQNVAYVTKCCYVNMYCASLKNLTTENKAKAYEQNRGIT